MTQPQKRTIGAVVFDGFETLDLFGPIQMFGTLADHFAISVVAQDEAHVTSRHGQRMTVDDRFADAKPYDLLLIPGGPGTWDQINNKTLLGWLQDAAPRADRVMSVCTGAAFLAKAGLLDGRAATTNKMNFDWVAQHGPDVGWQGCARWVEDGPYFTSSGVSAGMDMSLAVIDNLLGESHADHASRHSEYERQTDPGNDPFAVVYGTV